MKNHRIVLAARPTGEAGPEHFRLETVDTPAVPEGHVLVRVHYLSLDPYMRMRMNDAKSYAAPVGIGEVMVGGTVGEVLESRHEGFAAGDKVVCMGGWQELAVLDARTPGMVRKVDATHIPLSAFLGAVGMPGVTAWVGLNHIIEAKAGETIVVSAASGAVGSVVGQLAKAKGCRAVGLAGGADKCAYVVDELGFDACLDYKAGDLAGQLRAACPQGIDVNFENVGGDILDAVLPQMNTFGRVALCGLISGYNATAAPPGPKSFRAVLTQRLTVRGLIVTDWAPRIREAVAQLGEWHAEGRLKIREDVRTGGLPAFADTLNLLYTGGNNGKLVLKV